ncbi:MAG: lysylphosphatidylglycerol synthase transmembrane domain-containing protein [Deltaproteobacteria bacterium]|jgi:glycosyltransferase 2 family protein|nr:lysylphosphatidylglycerol synthase transmembrane domain-containing protein [Deltaproteobacteria bacterium]
MIPFLRRHLNFIIGLVISAAAVYLSLNKVDFRGLWNSFQSANYYFLIPAGILQFLCFFFKGVGWRFLLLPAKKEVRVSSTISVLVIGLMVNNLFPAKMGELARAYLIGERENLPKSLCLSTIMVEHLLDILVLLIFLILLMPLVSLPPWLKASGMGMGFLALAMIVFLFLVMRREEKFLNWVTRAAAWVPERFREKIQGILKSMLQGMRVVTGRYILYAFISLVAMWCTVFVVAYLQMAAFGFFLPFTAPIMVIIFMAFGKVIPSSPGGIGTLHYLIIVVLMSFGVSKEAALGCAILMHGYGFLIEVLTGLVLLFSSHLSLAKITRRAEEQA